LTIERMIEPRPPDTGEGIGFPADPHLASVPRLLYLRLGRAVE
jgi:hypothetical protein